jgi:hypothetical protein
VSAGVQLQLAFKIQKLTHEKLQTGMNFSDALSDRVGCVENMKN